MAYKYDDFVTAANAAGLLDKFTDDDLNIAKSNPEYGMSALNLQQELQKAQTTEQRLLAQETMNQLRSSYGNLNKQTGTSFLSSGNGGTQAPTQVPVQEAGGQLQDAPAGTAPQTGFTFFNNASGTQPSVQSTPAGTTPQPETGTSGNSFVYDGQTAYQALLDKILGMGPFSYDEQNDPSYGALKKTYLREGDRARADMLAKVSAATGGAPSSYAVTAASQAGDYYDTQFADMVPTLQQNAYQRYLGDFNTMMSQLGALDADRAFDYSAYLQQYERQKEAFDRLVVMMTKYDYQPTAEEMAAAGMSEEQMQAILKKKKNRGGLPADWEDYLAWLQSLIDNRPGGSNAAAGNPAAAGTGNEMSVK